MTSSPAAVSSACAGETVPQKGQTSAFLAGFHCASPPQAGQENFFWAVASGMVSGCLSGLADKIASTRGDYVMASDSVLPLHCEIQRSVLQEIIQRRAGDAPGGADFLAFERAVFQGGQHVVLADAESLATSAGLSNSGAAPGAGDGGRRSRLTATAWIGRRSWLRHLLAHGQARAQLRGRAGHAAARLRPWSWIRPSGTSRSR